MGWCATSVIERLAVRRVEISQRATNYNNLSSYNSKRHHLIYLPHPTRFA